MDIAKLKKCKKKLHEYDETKINSCPECRKISSRKGHEKRKQEPGYLEYHRNAQKHYYKRNGDSEEHRLIQRGNRLRTRYWPHLTSWEALQEYQRMLIAQEFCCKICEVHADEYKEYFHVDHDHSNLQVRGLLCSVCNRYLIAGIDMRAKAKKVHISLDFMLYNIYKYYDYKRTDKTAARKLLEYLLKYDLPEIK